MRVPTPIGIGRGVRNRKRSHGGVRSSRLGASAKNAKIASAGYGSHCSRVKRRFGIFGRAGPKSGWVVGNLLKSMTPRGVVEGGWGKISEKVLNSSGASHTIFTGSRQKGHD